MYGRALEDGHDDLSGAVSGDDTGDRPASDNEVPAGIEDAAVEQQGGEFYGGGSHGVEDFDYDETLFDIGIFPWIRFLKGF